MTNLFDKYSAEELLTINVKLLDLNQQVWGFSRGAKTTRDYLYDNDSVAVKIRYDYTYKNGDREIATVTRHIDMYDDQGAVQLTRDITKPMNITQLEELNRDIRRGRVDYLREAAKDLPSFSPFVPEPWKSDFLRGPDAVELLNNYYSEQMNEYIEKGSSSFEDAINAEDNLFMLDVLNLNVRPPDAEFPTGLTIKQSILHQLTGSY